MAASGARAIELTVLTANGKALPNVIQATGVVKAGYPNAGNANYKIFTVDHIQEMIVNQNPTTKNYPLQLAGASTIVYLRNKVGVLNDTFTVVESLATILAML
jgi:hypothetical protein